MGCYVQPLERARACFCEYGLSYDPENTEELKVLRNLHADLSEFLFDRGVLFTRPYGAQAEMVFGRATAYTNTLRDLKKIFDPKNIMNPGKLCF
jgi:FAD/FMN-containing dehydrogenase